MADTSHTTSRRRFLETLGATGVAATAGCLTQGSGPGTEEEPTPTPEDNTTETPDNDTETTPDNTTPQETPENTTEEPEESPEDTETPEENPGPNYDNLEQVYRNEVIKDDYLTHQIDENWDIIRKELEEQGHNLSNPEITEEFIEDIAAHGAVKASYDSDQNTGAQAYAHILYNKLDVTPEEALVAARTRNSQGFNVPIASILAQTEGDGNGYTKTQYQHAGNENDVKKYDHLRVLSPGETPSGTWEEAFADMWNPDRPAITSALESDGILSRLKARDSSEEYDIDPEKVQEGLAIANDNIVVGPMDTGNADIAYNTDGFKAVGDIINPNNINENPETVGELAHDVVSEASMKFYNEVAHNEDKYLRIDFTGNLDNNPSDYSSNDFVIETIGEETKEELGDALLKEELEQFKG